MNETQITINQSKQQSQKDYLNEDVNFNISFPKSC